MTTTIWMTAHGPSSLPSQMPSWPTPGAQFWASLHLSANLGPSSPATRKSAHLGPLVIDFSGRRRPRSERLLGLVTAAGATAAKDARNGGDFDRVRAIAAKPEILPKLGLGTKALFVCPANFRRLAPIEASECPEVRKQESSRRELSRPLVRVVALRRWFMTRIDTSV